MSSSSSTTPNATTATTAAATTAAAPALTSSQLTSLFLLLRTPIAQAVGIAKGLPLETLQWQRYSALTALLLSSPHIRRELTGSSSSSSSAILLRSIALVILQLRGRLLLDLSPHLVIAQALYSYLSPQPTATTTPAAAAVAATATTTPAAATTVTSYPVVQPTSIVTSTRPSYTAPVVAFTPPPPLPPSSSTAVPPPPASRFPISPTTLLSLLSTFLLHYHYHWHTQTLAPSALGLLSRTMLSAPHSAFAADDTTLIVNRAALSLGDGTPAFVFSRAALVPLLRLYVLGYALVRPLVLKTPIIKPLVSDSKYQLKLVRDVATSSAVQIITAIASTALFRAYPDRSFVGKLLRSFATAALQTLLQRTIDADNATPMSVIQTAFASQTVLVNDVNHFLFASSVFPGPESPSEFNVTNAFSAAFLVAAAAGLVPKTGLVAAVVDAV